MKDMDKMIGVGGLDVVHSAHFIGSFLSCITVYEEKVLVFSNRQFTSERKSDRRCVMLSKMKYSARSMI